MVLKDLNNTTTTNTSHIVVMERQQEIMKSTTLHHHQHHQLQRHNRPRQGRVVVIPKWAHHRGTTMKGTSIIMTMMIMVFIVINIILMTAIIVPHQGVQAFSTLPDFPLSPAFAFPNPPSFPDRKIEELFMQCGREVMEDRFFTEMRYSVKNFYRCDISRFWLEEARRDGIHIPLNKRMHLDNDEMRWSEDFTNEMYEHKFDDGMHKYHLRQGMKTFYDDGRDMQMGHHEHYDKMMDRDGKLHFFDKERLDGSHYEGKTMHGRELSFEPRDRYFNTEHFGDEMMHHGEFTKGEEEFCRRAERAEYCLGGDMMVSCMWRKAQWMLRDEMERKEEKSFEEAKYFLGRVQEYLEESLCKRFGGEILECEVPMQQLGFAQWPITPMFTKEARFPLGGCRSISKRF